MKHPAGTFVWESATLPTSQLTPGWVAPQYLTLLTLGLFLPLGLLFAWLFGSPYASLLALPFARLLAFDLTTFTLPDVYTLPLLAVGLAHVATFALWPQALAAFLILASGMALAQYLPKAGLGGGDIKLLAALFLFLPPENASFATALGCFLWLPVAFFKPKATHPFGVPLILGWLLWLAYNAIA